MDEEGKALLALTFLKGLSHAKALSLYRQFGKATTIFAQVHQLTPSWRRPFDGAADAFERAEKEWAWCCEQGVNCIPMSAATYPQRLKDTFDAPLMLYSRGKVGLNPHYALSVVGTRHITEYGKAVCRELMVGLAQQRPDVMVVSGLAYGVDIHAHRECVANELSTVGVLAHGLDRLYPALHKDTANAMCAQGGLLTEYPHGTNADKGNFVRRNRIVAGMTDATIVVESAEKGGALITANYATTEGRKLFAVPGKIGAPYSAGCLSLLHDGTARMYLSVEQLLDDLSWPSRQQALQPIEQDLFDCASPEEHRILSLFQDDANYTVSEVAQQLAQPFATVNALLMGLELKGKLKGLPGGRFCKSGI